MLHPQEIGVNARSASREGGEAPFRGWKLRLFGGRYMRVLLPAQTAGAPELEENFFPDRTSRFTRCIAERADMGRCPEQRTGFQANVPRGPRLG